MLHGDAGSARAKAMAHKRNHEPPPLPPIEPVSLATPTDVHGVIEDTVARIRANRLDPQRGYAIASLCRVALDVLALIPRHPGEKSEDQPQPTPKRPAWAPPDLELVPEGPQAAQA